MLLLFTVSLSTIWGTCGQSIAISDAQNQNVEAYISITNAFKNGADVSGLTAKLNQALDLVSKAASIMYSNPQQAETLAIQAQDLSRDVTQQANSLEKSGLGTFPIVEVSLATSLIVVGILIFLFGPKVYRRFKGSNDLNGIKKEKGRLSFITAEKVCAAILGITIVLALISLSGILIPIDQSESFSELGILSEQMTMDNYPSQTVANQSIHFFGYVGNHIGEPMLYTVMLKLGDNQTVENPTPIPPFKEYSQVVSNSKNWVFPIDVTLNKTGINQRIIFELWAYNQTLSRYQYQGIYGHINIDVTAPLS